MKQSRKEFIIEAHKHACSEWQNKISDEFPGLFKVKPLEVGKWYKYNSCLLCYQNTNVNLIAAYGFLQEDDWTDTGNMGCSPEEWKPATDKEVETALIKEAKKRGFKEGVNIIRSWSEHNTKVTLMSSNKSKYFSNLQTLDVGGWQVFREGKWATIIETITKEQAEKELGKTILN